MKKSAGKIFTVQFIKSLFFIVLFIGIIIFCYRAIMQYYGINDTDDTSTISPIDNKQSTKLIASIDDISKHLIFSVDEDTGAIKKLVLEIFNCETHRMVFITIPIKTQFTLSDSLYHDLILVKPSIPQFLKISAISSYFPKEAMYEYGVLMIEDLLNIQISYYSVVPESLYETVFETDPMGEVFSDNFIEFLHTITTEDDLRNYLENIYTLISSNLSLEDKFNYIESYLSDVSISFEVIAGEDSNSAYLVDELMAAKQIEDYVSE